MSHFMQVAEGVWLRLRCHDRRWGYRHAGNILGKLLRCSLRIESTAPVLILSSPPLVVVFRCQTQGLRSHFVCEYWSLQKNPYHECIQPTSMLPMTSGTGKAPCQCVYRIRRRVCPRCRAGWCWLVRERLYAANRGHSREPWWRQHRLIQLTK